MFSAAASPASPHSNIKMTSHTLAEAKILAEERLELEKVLKETKAKLEKIAETITGELVYPDNEKYRYGYDIEQKDLRKLLEEKTGMTVNCCIHVEAEPVLLVVFNSKDVEKRRQFLTQCIDAKDIIKIGLSSPPYNLLGLFNRYEDYVVAQIKISARDTLVAKAKQMPAPMPVPYTANTAASAVSSANTVYQPEIKC